MSVEVQLSAETIACLRDEAYAQLCRNSLTKEAAAAAHETQRIEATRPPFGLLASKRTREGYETSLRSAIHTQNELHERLTQVGQLEQWLRHRIQRSLDDYLALASPHYQVLHQITAHVVRWQSALGESSEHVLAFARELRRAAEPQSSRNDTLHAIASVRAAAANLQLEVAKVALLADQTARLSEGKLAPGFRLPPLPAFRTTAWVDRILVLSHTDSLGELNRAEAEAREFYTTGRNQFAEQANQLRHAAEYARQTYLADYWQQLRDHALQHYVAPRDVDDVLTELIAHYVVAEVQQHQAKLESDPFSMAR